MSQLPHCPKCTSIYTYKDRDLLTCPECAYEWNITTSSEENKINLQTIVDAHGTALEDGDNVTLIKELKVKDSSSVIKVGTKVRAIHLVRESSDDHNIHCKVKDLGSIKLKSEFVKKSK